MGITPPVVQRMYNCIHQINHCPVASVVCFANILAIYQEGSVNSPLEQLGPELRVIQFCLVILPIELNRTTYYVAVPGY